MTRQEFMEYNHDLYVEDLLQRMALGESGERFVDGILAQRNTVSELYEVVDQIIRALVDGDTGLGAQICRDLKAQQNMKSFRYAVIFIALILGFPIDDLVGVDAPTPMMVGSKKSQFLNLQYLLRTGKVKEPNWGAINSTAPMGDLARVLELRETHPDEKPWLYANNYLRKTLDAKALKEIDDLYPIPEASSLFMKCMKHSFVGTPRFEVPCKVYRSKSYPDALFVVWKGAYFLGYTQNILNELEPSLKAGSDLNTLKNLLTKRTNYDD